VVQFQNARQLVATEAPEVPVICRRPELARRAASYFTEHFAGTPFYAVKANPAPWLIETLHSAGIDHFDAASLEEIELVRAHAPGTMIGFMHPVKSEGAIREAYQRHSVRIFSLDSLDELAKFQRVLPNAKDLTLCVRLQVGSDLAKITLASKFGADESVDVELLRVTRGVAERLGVCFHVGSQAMSPAAFTGALSRAERAVRRAGVILDVLDVGGGFPAVYPGMEPPSLGGYFTEIEERFRGFPSAGNAELWCEPGRALSADGESVVCKVLGRRGDALFINDGGYGSLYDAAHLGWRYPAANLSREGEEAPFGLYGPTCDDADQMRGPFFLPEDTQTGDYIELGTLGAYGRSMKTGFNGYGSYLEAELCDNPFPSLYPGQSAQQKQDGACETAAEEMTR
jgi:ornithine decarboxylase